MSDPLAEETSPPPAPPTIAQVSRFRLVLRFAIIPVSIVLLGVVLFLFYSAAMQKEKSPEELLDDLQGRGVNKPWQAAFELARRLHSSAGQAVSPALADRMVDTFEQSAAGDPRIRCFLALALANTKGERTLKALDGALADSSAEVRIHAAIALGIYGDADAAPHLMRFLESNDAGELKAGICALGMLRSPEALEPLKQFLSSDSDEIRWNAALAVANFGDPSALPVLFQMLDQDYLTSVSASKPAPAQPQETAFGRWGVAWPFGNPMHGFDEEQRVRVTRQALAALTKLKAAETIPAVRKLLEAPQEELQWSAALALVEFSDASGIRALEGRLDRRVLLRKGLGHAASSEILKQAVQAVGHLRQFSSVPLLERLQKEDPDSEVRRVAAEALAKFQ